ncbi:cell division protein FtsZ [Flavobacterium sp.]|jgi:cell division protein FtsZ|uniref:cell division protein FtsZ n=1 Tax=Flavobacterium sp. TaxID=239 RepID=UPI0037C0E143
MISNSDFGSISFDLPKNQSNVIKVIGVGGGGSNAINHMFKQGIKGVDFVVCNTDSQALQNSPVPNKIQLGVNLTEGLGAGANPEVGQQSALESMEDIDKLLDSNTKMIFITAGMGGGTGTGAAPVIAQMAKEKDILTVGIVTIPFQFEGKVRSEQAMSGVERLRKQVDSLIVINNNKLREVYGNLGFKAGFSKADEVLATASRGIAEVITHHYTQNIDLKDAKTVLSNSGTAIMGSAIAEGENRAKDAIVSALDSPLLNDNKITGAKNVLLLIVSGSTEITIDEIGEINDHIQAEAGYNANIIMGVGEDDSLGDSIAVTIIATGFNVEQQKEIVNAEPKKIIHSLEENQTNTIDLSQKAVAPMTEVSFEKETPKAVSEDKIVFELIEELEVIEPKMVSDLIPTTDFIKNIDVAYEIVSPFSDNHLFATTQEVREIIVKDPEFVIVEKEQVTLSFDLSIEKKVEAEAEKTVFFELDPIATNEIIVNEPKQVIPMTEVNETGVVRYSLEEYMEVESELLNSKPIVNVVEEPINEEMNITMKKVETPSAFSPSFDEINPITELTIEETLKMRADERRKKLKEFNYKFHNNSSRLDEMEKVPAYKRMGVDLPTNSPINNQSKTSLGTDSNNDAQLRSNNSFLHDNVD